jgi:penicillin amidase
LIALGLILSLLLGGPYLMLYGSLPHADGRMRLAGLTAAVEVERDALGTVSFKAADRADLDRALGFVHAQERYFEMDLMRRQAAGELAALLGDVALPLDRAARRHRMRARVRAQLERLTENERAVLERYRDGVNAGLAALWTRPWPYLLLRQRPEPWRSEDTLLVVAAMYFLLQDADNTRERRFSQMRDRLPPALVDHLLRVGTEWDAPLAAPADTTAYPWPGPDELDLRRLPDPDRALRPLDTVVGGDSPGSNFAAVAGALTEHGAAMLANDMHLPLKVPNLWFRQVFQYRLNGAEHRVVGLGLPGIPGMVTGSNGYLAWGYTNAYGDWADSVRVEFTDAARTHYHTRSLPHAIERHRERIESTSGHSEELEVLETQWGPILGSDVDGTPLAVSWVAHYPGAIDLRLIELERTSNVGQALDVVIGAGMPHQNVVLVDRGGQLAWTVSGKIPIRAHSFDPRFPVDGRAIDQIWNLWMPPAATPRVLDPESGRLWSGNQRKVGGIALTILGLGSYEFGARAKQIRDGLYARERFSERDLLAIALDDRALFMQRWWELLQKTLAAQPTAELTALAAAAPRWEGHAATDAVAYRQARAFRLAVHERVLSMLAVPILTEHPDFAWPRLPQVEGVVWQLLADRPPHLLSARYADYDALLRDAALDVHRTLAEQPGDLAERTWGEINVLELRHPLSRGVPWLARWLDLPAQSLPGDAHMPRVQGRSFGASERLIVAPGHEEQGLLHMPGGQSGHPLSPYYGAGHADWAAGRPTPLLPGAPRQRLVLQP